MKSHIRTPDARETTAWSANQRLIEALAVYEKVITPGRGAVLFDRGQVPVGVYVLLEGTVEMAFDAPAPNPIGLSIAGTILGLNALVADRTMDYTALATEDTVVGWVPKDAFFRVLEGTPALWMDVLKVLSRDVGSCYDRVRELAEYGHAAPRLVAEGRVQLMG